MRRITLLILVILSISCSKKSDQADIWENYDFEKIVGLLPEDVKVISLGDNKYIAIDNLERTDKNKNYYYKLSASEDTIAIAWPELYTVLDDKTLYDGRIDIYKSTDNDKLYLDQEIYPPFKKNYTNDKGYIDFGNDFRTLSNTIDISGDQLLVNAGHFMIHKGLKGFKGLTNKEALEKIKSMDIFSDQVYLYKKNDKNKWELRQRLDPDLGYDDFWVTNTYEEVSFTQPNFGNSLSINGLNALIFNEQTTEKLYLYKNINGLLTEVASYPMTRAVRLNISMSTSFSIFTQGEIEYSDIIIINNDTTEVVAKLKSPLYPHNREFGESVYIGENMAIISETWFDIPGYDPRPNFPGYVHTYKRSIKGEWAHLETLTSPMSEGFYKYGGIMISNDDYLVVASEAKNPNSYDRDGLPCFIHIYKKENDLFKLVTTLYDSPEQDKTLYYSNISFFKKGLLIGYKNYIKYLPNLFE